MSLLYADDGWKDYLRKPRANKDYRCYVDFRQQYRPPFTGHGLAYTATSASDNSPGSYVADILTAGTTQPDYAVDLPDEFTLWIRVKPNHAYDVAGDKPYIYWPYDANDYWLLRYDAGGDYFQVDWSQSGTNYTLETSAFTSDASLQVWHDIFIVQDLDTVGTGNSLLYLNWASEDEVWSGSIAVRDINFPLLEMGHDTANTTYADAYFAFVRLWPGYKASTDDIANRMKDVKDEEVYWDFNGHGMGRTRCNVTSRMHHVDIEFTRETETEAVIANHGNLYLMSPEGQFADDQYAAFDAANEVYNGTSTQRYMQQHNEVEVETWWENEFEPLIRGRVDEHGFRRISRMGDISRVQVTFDDFILEMQRSLVQRDVSYEDYKLCDTSDEAASLLHVIGRVGLQGRIRNYAGNSSFEGETLSDSWTATTPANLTKQAGGLFGSNYAENDNTGGGAVEALSQTVDFYDGTNTSDHNERLNVGDVFTFGLYLRCSAPAADNLVLYEDDSGGSNDNTTAAYSLSGGEGWTWYEVTHTITDSDSDRLRIVVEADDAVTLDMDGAWLVRDATTPDWYSVNSTDGASAVADADDYAEGVYDRVGFDVVTLNYTHPWCLLHRDNSVWGYVDAIGKASGTRFIGFEWGGVFRHRAVLQTGYSEPTSLDVIRVFKDELRSHLNPKHANIIVVQGIRIVEETMFTMIWNAKNTNLWTRDSGGQLAQSVANGAYWPDATTDPKYVATYGLFTPAQYEEVYTPHGAVRQMVSEYKTPASGTEVIGVKNATMRLKVRLDTDPESSDMLTAVVFDTTTHADGAEILYKNSTGSAVTLYGAAIIGQAIVKLKESEGFIHDWFRDLEDIRRKGPKPYRLANDMIVTLAQTNSLADWAWKTRLRDSHEHSFSKPGNWSWLLSGERVDLKIGSAGLAENINKTCEVKEVVWQYDASGEESSKVTLDEAYENWTADSTYEARQRAAGVPTREQAYQTVIVAASDYTDDAQYYCDGTDDEVQVQAAIDYATAIGGGIVSLTTGQFDCDTSTITLKDNVILEGAGTGGTILEKNGNFATITINGVDDVTVRNIQFTRDAADTNNTDYISLGNTTSDNTSRITLENLYFNASYQHGLHMMFCNNVKVVNCRAYDCGNGDAGFFIEGSIDFEFVNCVADTCDDHGFEFTSRNPGPGLVYPQGTLTNCIAKNSVAEGFDIHTARETTFSGCQAINNGANGFDLSISLYCTFASVAAWDNTSAGMALDTASHFNTIQLNAYDNDTGLSLVGDSNVINIVAEGNTTDGILINAAATKNVITYRAVGNGTDYTDNGAGTVGTGVAG